MSTQLAPALEVAQWLNSQTPIVLEGLRGRVVVIEAFQLLCPGCVSHGLPQAVRAYETFPRDDVIVLGLHCVFEHHSAQGGHEVLKAFLQENRIQFPVGMDEPSASGGVPGTMAKYQLQGTPSIILIDREGHLRFQHFGQVSDMALGAQIMTLVQEGAK